MPLDAALPAGRRRQAAELIARAQRGLAFMIVPLVSFFKCRSCSFSGPSAQSVIKHVFDKHSPQLVQLVESDTIPAGDLDAFAAVADEEANLPEQGVGVDADAPGGGNAGPPPPFNCSSHCFLPLYA